MTHTPHHDTSNSRPAPAARRFGARALVAAAIAGAAMAGAGGYVIGHRHAGGPDAVAASPSPAPKAGAEREGRQQYQCPMHPTVISDDPDDDCPICGMALVPMESAPAGGTDPSSASGLAAIEIDPARQQLIGLTTAPVEKGPIGGEWRTSGKVAVDETRVHHVNVKIPGFVERIHVDFVGRPVKKGEPLYSIYSPELLSAQQEYVLALETSERLGGRSGFGDDGGTLVASARRKLELWDVPAAEIRRLERTREPSKTLTLRSPVTGVVVKKDVVQGMKLDAGAMPYEIVDLSSVWVLADVYESELRNVEVGMPARLTLQAFPNRTFEGEVAFIDPFLDPRTRTAKVRVSFPNPKGDLRPEMFGEVVLQGERREALRVPVDAVIDSGTRRVVFVALGDGKFEPREVQLGDSDRDRVEVVSGLHEGEEVVTRANFLVDSESRLRSSLEALSADAKEEKRARVLPDGASGGADDAAAPDPHAGHGAHR